MQARIRLPRPGRSAPAAPVASPLLCVLPLLLLAAPPAPGDTLWIEGEAAARHDFKRHGWYDDVRKDVFSGGEWLSHYDAASPGTALYRLRIEHGGPHTLWLRCNYFKCEMDYRQDGGAFEAIDLSSPRDTLLISAKPDHRFIGWVKVGKLDLREGERTLELRIKSHLQNHGGIDAFCLVEAGSRFVPSGTTKPGEAEARVAGPSDWFPVVASGEAPRGPSVTDRSHDLERPAGKQGFLRRDGKDLRFARGKAPVRFWGVGANADRAGSSESEGRRADYLARNGVTMVRQHSVFELLGPRRQGRFDAKRLEALDRWFAALKERGIYMTWSVFYPLEISAGDGYPPELFSELEGGKTYGLVNVSRKLQDLQLEYVRALLDHVNPHTKLAYKRDPALAVLELQNEDCIFFHMPLNDLATGKKWPRHTALLREAFRGWARRRYKTDAALEKAWGRGASLSAPDLRLHGAWELDGKEPDAQKGDFIRFLTELQRDFYARREEELRAAGFQGVTVSTAWRAGGAGADPANLYSDTAMDMIDRHNYLGGGAGRHRIEAGEVSVQSHLDRPGSGLLASGLYQVEDRPFSMTEWTESPPDPWKAEAAPLIAFYGMGLQGWDASYHFASHGDRLGDGWPDLSWYSSDTPHYMGQFPALSLAVTRGDIAEAPIVAARRLALDDLFTGADPLGQDLTGEDHDRKEPRGPLATPAEALLVGRVTVSFDGKQSERVNLAPFIDRNTGVIQSATGELSWDSRRRRVLVHAARTQAVIGSPGPEEIALPCVRIRVKTGFVSLIFSSLDGRDLVQSRSILLTALARDRQSGAVYSEDQTELTAVGGPPLLLEPVEARITLEGTPPEQVEVLDLDGVPTAEHVPVEGGSFAIDGRFRTYLYHIRRAP